MTILSRALFGGIARYTVRDDGCVLGTTAIGLWRIMGRLRRPVTAIGRIQNGRNDMVWGMYSVQIKPRL